jgi:Tol biopolymer transport system component
MSKRRAVAIIALALLGGAAVVAAFAIADKESRWNLAPAETNPHISLPQQERLEKIPQTSAIVYHLDGHIFTMDRDGGNATQISFEKPQGSWEHVAASYDRKFIAANEQMPNPESSPGGHSRLWLYNLADGTRIRLVPAFAMAGNGGVDWDKNGFIYFAGKERDEIPDPRTPAEFRANAGGNDIYRMKADGSSLQRLTRTADFGEADVSVSADSTMIAYANMNIPEEVMEIWTAQADGSHARRVFKGGKNRVLSVHDPELSPDNRQVVFSRVNAEVPPNFPDNPDANTAHDLYRTRIDGSGLTRLTKPGHISITPDWRDDAILFLDISEKERYAGLSTVSPDKPDQVPQLLRDGANIGKWIPE